MRPPARLKAVAAVQLSSQRPARPSRAAVERQAASTPMFQASEVIIARQLSGAAGQLGTQATSFDR